jgi:hypothetical protein
LAQNCKSSQISDRILSDQGMLSREKCDANLFAALSALIHNKGH